MAVRIDSLFLYPVKSCGPVPVDHVEVEAEGFADDRRWMLVDPSDTFVTRRTHPGLARIGFRREGAAWRAGDGNGPGVLLPDAGSSLVGRTKATIWRDTVEVAIASRSVCDWFSERAGSPVRLVRMAPWARRAVDPAYGRAGDAVSFADGYPVLITTTASLAVLNDRLGSPVTMSRFRPNLVLSGNESFAEDRWRRLRIGGVELDVVKPCARCVVVDQDPPSGVRAPGVLAALAAFRASGGKVMFGQNAVPRVPGRIRVGDPVEILQEGSARPAGA